MNARFGITGAVMTALVCAVVSGASAQAPPSGRGDPPVWSSHDMQLLRHHDGRTELFEEPTGGVDHLSGQNGLVCQPQTLFDPTPFFLTDKSEAAETTGSAR